MSDPGDIRLRDVIVSGEEGTIVLLGYPSDEGVRRNGGRVGAAAGPGAVRQCIARGYTCATDAERGLSLVGSEPSRRWISDGGDVDASASLELAHTALTSRVEALVAAGRIPFVIGGGNDQSAANGMGLFRGLLLRAHSACGAEQSPPDATAIWASMGVVNIDAHLDVRPLKPLPEAAHSGSPFRQLLEAGLPGRQFCEFGAQGAVCAAAHADWLRQRGGRIVWLSELRRSRSVAERFRQALDDLQTPSVFVSFDIDAIASADCPGVSAPGVVGLSAQEALDICFVAGSDPRVKLFDLSEFNPVIEEWRTSRLVVAMLHAFCMGVVARRSD